MKLCPPNFFPCQPTFRCQRWLKALAQDAPSVGEGDLHMLAALRRAGSVLPKQARSRQRELQSRRRCLPAEPGGAAPTLVQVGRVLQAEPAQHPHDQTDGPEGADMPRGQSLAVTVAASTRQTWFQQLTSGNCGIFCQLPSSLHVDGRQSEACSGLTASPTVPGELAAVSRRPTCIHPHRVSKAPHMGAFEATARECRVELTPPIGADRSRVSYSSLP